MNRLEHLKAQVALFGLFEERLRADTKKRFQREYENLFSFPSCSVGAVVEKLEGTGKLNVGLIENTVIQADEGELGFLFELLFDLMRFNGEAEVPVLLTVRNEGTAICFTFSMQTNAALSAHLDQSAYSNTSERSLFSIYFPTVILKWGGRYEVNDKLPASVSVWLKAK